jgi:hypothetical protein
MRCVICKKDFEPNIKLGEPFIIKFIKDVYFRQYRMYAPSTKKGYACYDCYIRYSWANKRTRVSLVKQGYYF